MARIAITGGTGFVGRHLARRLIAQGHEVVVVARGVDRRDPALRSIDKVTVVEAGLSDLAALREAFEGCSAIVHCAGINREVGDQTYRAVHIDGTSHVVGAARSAGVDRLVVLSFLRARPDGPSRYHRSKWAAEELVRTSGLRWTVVKAGVIYGRGDHMLDHLSHALWTFPLFGLVGLPDRPIRPVAIDDVVRVLSAAAVGDERLDRRTIALVGPERLTLEAAVRRVARVVGRNPVFVALPVALHRLLAIGWEKVMVVPLVSRAQVEILAEGVADPAPFSSEPPEDLRPRTPFSDDVIRAGLPEPGPFTRRDLRWSA